MIRCNKCGVLYSEGQKHKCDIKILQGFQIGKRQKRIEVIELIDELNENGGGLDDIRDVIIRELAEEDMVYGK